MGKHKSGGKDKGKGSQLVIRIDKSERAAFVSLCEKLDTSAAREIRRFMREFVAQNATSPDATAEAPADQPVATDGKADVEPARPAAAGAEATDKDHGADVAEAAKGDAATTGKKRAVKGKRSAE